MLSGLEAVEMYRKGIQVLQGDHQKYEQTYNQPLANLALKQSASALACIAELYMTEPLCDEPDAEQICEQTLAKALQSDSQNIDAL